MLGIIKFELDIRIKQIISNIIEKKAIKRNGYYEFKGNTKLVNRYGIEKCGAVFMNGSIYIIWDESFYNKLSAIERLYCRYHELGHFNGFKSLTELISNERKLHEEVRADSYAVKKIGFNDTINAMNNILIHLNEEQQNEMKQRINIQQSMHIAKQVITSSL